MIYIKTYESYLKGGHQPLYHITRNLLNILKDDILKTSKTADSENAICFTRSSTYDLDYGDIQSRLVLDYDKLEKDGYVSHPYDGQGVFGTKHLPKKDKKLKYLNKINYKWRPPKHNLNLPETDNDDFSWEYEERIYKDIYNLGKYLIAIDLDEKVYKKYKIELEKYIEKYPHIKLVKLINNKYWNRNNEY